jgi:hypothetical protein
LVQSEKGSGCVEVVLIAVAAGVGPGWVAQVSEVVSVVVGEFGVGRQGGRRQLDLCVSSPLLGLLLKKSASPWESSSTVLVSVVLHSC